MGMSNPRFFRALVSAALVSCACPLMAADRAPSGNAGPRLVPFPEDELEPAVKPATKPAAPPASSKTGFKPRFKTPAINQVQHLESTADEAASTIELKSSSASDDSHTAEPAKAEPREAQPIASNGRALLDEAFAKSKGADSDQAYGEIIDLCRKGLKAGVNKNYEEYSRRLMGWAYNRRGELRAKESRDQEALADFEAAVELNNKGWRAIHNRGVSYATLGRPQEAMADFDRTIQLNPKYVNAYYNRGELRYELEDFAGAVDDYTTALEVGQADPMVLNSRGHALYRMKQYGEALRDYSHALQIDPENAPTLTNRGDTYSDMGYYADAAKDYRAAIKNDPKLGRAYLSAAWLMATCPDEHYRNEKLAIDAAKKAIELDGAADYRYLETLAAAQANAGLFSEAKATQEKAIAKASQHELVTAEKRMAMYQREIAFRENVRNSFATPEADAEPNMIQRASGMLPLPPQRRANPRPLPRNTSRPNMRPNPQSRPDFLPAS